MHPTSRSLRAHQSRRDHRALFRPETGSRSFAGSWDPRLGPLLSNDRGHLPEARMLLRERKFHDTSFATSATCHGGAPRTDSTCLRSAFPHVRAVDAVRTCATLQPRAPQQQCGFLHKSLQVLRGTTGSPPQPSSRDNKFAARQAHDASIHSRRSRGIVSRIRHVHITFAYAFTLEYHDLQTLSVQCIRQCYLPTPVLHPRKHRATWNDRFTRNAGHAKHVYRLWSFVKFQCAYFSTRRSRAPSSASGGSVPVNQPRPNHTLCGKPNGLVHTPAPDVVSKSQQGYSLLLRTRRPTQRARGCLRG